VNTAAIHPRAASKQRRRVGLRAALPAQRRRVGLRAALSLLLVGACGGAPSPAAPVAGTPAAAKESAVPPAAVDQFLARIAQHCGQAFAGHIVANQPPADDDPFAGKPLIMHVRECRGSTLEIPFHVGDDHSRTWVLTRTAEGLRLEHDHRHEDGSAADVTMYGGATAAPGTASRQEFPAGAASIAMFERAGLGASVTNTWAMEIEPGQRFLYELSRPGGRLFQVAFDLTAPVETPQAPWGHE